MGHPMMKPGSTYPKAEPKRLYSARLPKTGPHTLFVEPLTGELFVIDDMTIASLRDYPSESPYSPDSEPWVVIPDARARD